MMSLYRRRNFSMGFMKRIILFLVVNFLVITTIGILLNLFNIRPYLSHYGFSYFDLLLYCFIWGMTGAFISLALSRIMAKMMMGVKVINPNSSDPREQQLLGIVYSLAQKAQLPDMPEVGIFHSPEVNAFATGPTKRRALVAVSSGLLQQMDSDQVEAILGHEITHVSNGDMVTMTLLQGVINAFVMFLARVLALAISGIGKGNRKGGSYGTYMILTFVFQSIFTILGSMLIFWFSRQREYRADSGGAKLAGKEKMIHALQGLQSHVHRQVKTPQTDAIEAYKISTPSKHGFAELFASHPPLEKRIAALKESQVGALI
jgi:heat shock protein HtpX